MSTSLSMLEKLKLGKNVYGTCLTSVSPGWPIMLKKAGLDFAFIDTEHTAINRADMAKMSQAVQAYGVTPVVRIPSPDPYLVCQAIDAGAKGVIAPYLESVEQIKDLVGAVKFRPLKGEILRQVLNGEKELSGEMKLFLDQYNKGNMAIANIESVPAMNKLEELLSVPGLDGVFIGPHDLSISLGIPEQYNHPEFEKAVQYIIQTTRKKGLAIGIHFSLEPGRQIQWMKEGANIVVHSSDIALFSQKLNADMQIIKSAAGDADPGSEGAKEESPVI